MYDSVEMRLYDLISPVMGEPATNACWLVNVEHDNERIARIEIVDEGENGWLLVHRWVADRTEDLAMLQACERYLTALDTDSDADLAAHEVRVAMAAVLPWVVVA